jgi:plasmid replication initiation protein
MAQKITKHYDNYQPNIITRSRQEFTLIEKKMMVLFINQIDFETIKDRPNENLKFKIPVTELGGNREEIKQACESITSKKIRNLDGDFSIIVPFPLTRYINEGMKGYVELTMLADVIPHFVELKNQYTRYNLEIMLNMRSVYSQRLFEIVMMHKGRGQYSFQFSVDRLQNILNCKYDRYNDFKRWALLAAQKELAEKAGIVLDFAPCKKEGRRITEIAFTLKTEKQLAIEAVNEEFNQYEAMDIATLLQTAIQLLKNYTFTNKQKDEILMNRELLIKFLEVESKVANGQHKAKNPTAYIAKSLGWGGKKK